MANDQSVEPSANFTALRLPLPPMEDKFEIRSTKLETDSKHKTQISKSPVCAAFVVCSVCEYTMAVVWQRLEKTDTPISQQTRHAPGVGLGVESGRA
jgi:hypothetical protein